MIYRKQFVVCMTKRIASMDNMNGYFPQRECRLVRII